MRKLAVSLAALAAAIATPVLAETVAITNARILTAGPAGEISNGLVVIENGKIKSVLDQTTIRMRPFGADVRVIDAKGGVVTPGLIAPNALIGAVEVRSLGDDLAVSNPDIGAAFDVQYGLNPASTLIPVARLAGITRAIVTPLSAGGGGGSFHDDDGEELMTAGDGGGSKSTALFAGQAAVIHLGEATDILVKPQVGMVVAFGEGGASVAGGARGAQIVALKAAFRDVRDYVRNRAAYDRAGLRGLALSKVDLEALIPVVEGRMPIIAVVHKASDIRTVLQFAREEKVKVILSGAEEGWMVAKEIAAARVPVIMDPLSNRPDSFQVLGSTLENAARLNAAGVTVAFEGTGGAHRVRALRLNAGNAVANGMPYAAALAAVTINTAKIFGVADQVGSLEPGKDADLVIWTGDPFEPLSQPTAVFIRGESQPMTSRQIELRDRYKTLGGAYPPAYSN